MFIIRYAFDIEKCKKWKIRIIAKPNDTNIAEMRETVVLPPIVQQKMTEIE